VAPEGAGGISSPAPSGAVATASLADPSLGPYQLQAAIAATHASAATPEETNWAQVHALYLILERMRS